MKVIRDIRVYRSQTENIPGNSLPSEFAGKELNIMLHRIAMKLRENNFSMGDFDHLYINLTTCNVEEGIAPSGRGRDRYHPWFRYYDVQTDQEFYDSLGTPECNKKVIEIAEKVLQKFFCSEQFTSELISSCVSEAVNEGENMLMRYKEKKSSGNKAIIYLRYLDSGRFFPLLRVYDSEEKLILEKDLPETGELFAYGEIQLSSKKITIKPRKNYFARELEPMTFML